MSNGTKDDGRTFPYRRLVFAGLVIVIMTLAAGVAVFVGFELVKVDPADASLGTVALVVSPAVTLIATLSTILVNLLREQQN